MKEAEILKMHSLIEEGVRQAQDRLWQRAGKAHQSLVVCRGGKIVEVMPEGQETSAQEGYDSSDPLARR